ncbi:MAG: 23S rRNA (uracil(1939)-C(5))-methyltransferase RlmD [Candidatus Omnitrophota bacterium]|nr:23S rRNA (uracil(1939)-C(5))-methyltransferase RlmD [Candidatus Omnitrophota bacterium]
MQICKHFGQCGGCSFQDIPYETQLRSKEEKVKELMSMYGVEAEVKPINAYPQWFYRNKIEFSFGVHPVREQSVLPFSANDSLNSQNNSEHSLKSTIFSNGANGKLACGFYKKGSHIELIDIEECLIFSQAAADILRAVKDFANSRNYPTYNKFTYKGFLRNLIIRETKFTKEIMLGLVTTSAESLDKKGLIKELISLELEAKIKSIYWIINDSWSDAVVFEKKELLYGEPFIQEDLDGLLFKIGIDSFFQVNPRAIKDFYAKIRTYANLKGEEKVLDLFCGGGGIGIFLAKTAKFVWAVEIEKAIIDAAWENAKLNSIENISFFASDTRKFLNSQAAFYKDIDVLVINPPRSGLSNKIKRAILRLTPKRIFYSSCNPDTLFRDLKEFSTDYKIDFIEPFDFFPHTPHVECLAALHKA